MGKRRYDRGIVINAISVVAGILFSFLGGWCVSNYFYEKSREDVRASLLDAALSDIEKWESVSDYPMLYDSAGYSGSGKVWPKLSLNGVQELSRNLNVFRHTSDCGDFAGLVRECEREAEGFNDRLLLRNISIVTAPSLPGLAREMSPKAYHSFQTEVLPVAQKLDHMLQQDRRKLVNSNTRFNSLGEGRMSIYEIISIVMSLAGLVGLLLYVRKTTLIAETSVRHNEIISHPAVTVSLCGNDELPWRLDHIWVLVQNHTPIHAKMTILIECEVKEELGSISLKTSTPFTTGAYSGKEVWNIGAMGNFVGHTCLDNLKNRQLNASETAIINITADVSPFDRDDFRPIPQTQYIWKGETSEWVPHPVPNR
jgi:hypothetical protein